jgi:hypothetical protein
MPAQVQSDGQQMRRAVLRMDIGQPDGVNVAEELASARGDER